MQAGNVDPKLFFSDRPRVGRPHTHQNSEYISIFADDAPGVLMGRSPMQCYEDFMVSFRDTFHDDLGSFVSEAVVGAGPCGELRYPSYAKASGWCFPGVSCDEHQMQCASSVLKIFQCNLSMRASIS